MRLLRADINNFRSIKDQSIPFEPSCQVLVGINESGKSNILKALAFLDPDREVVPDDLRNSHPDENPVELAYVRFVFSFDKNERIKNIEIASEEILTKKASAAILSIDGKEKSLAQVFDFLSEGLYIVNISQGSRRYTHWKLPEDHKLVGEWKKPKEAYPANIVVDIGDGSELPLKKYKLVHSSAFDTVSEDYLMDADVNDVTSLVFEQISSFIKENLPDCLYWEYSESDLLPPQINLAKFASDPSDCEPLRRMFALADIHEIQDAIAAADARSNGIRNLLNRVADQASKHIKNVWKEYRGITIELAQNGPNIDASIKDEHNVYNFARRSDGFKRFITFLLMVSAKVKTNQLQNTLILYDEPDISLHPSGARYLRDELIKISKNNYLVYSTHSIFMIDRELLERHLIVEKKSEITTAREANESNVMDEEVLYNALGAAIFDNLKKKNILFEGWRDKKLFQIALKSLPPKFRELKKKFIDVGVCHAKGVKDINRITPMLELGGLSWFIISDGDKAAVEHQKDYKGEGPWYRYDELLSLESPFTGEDFIKPSAFKGYLKSIASENESLSEFPLENFGNGGTKLQAIRRWLKQGGIRDENCKKILDSLKERLFDSLKPSQIEERYYEIIGTIAKKV